MSSKRKTFAQYLVEQALPPGMELTRPLDKKETERILTEVFSKHTDQYGAVVSSLKKLGDTFSTYESLSFGMDEIEVPNKANRDKIISKYKSLLSSTTDPGKKLQFLEKAQNEIADNDLKDTKDDASFMVTSGAMGGKRFQLMKLRSSPVVLKDHKGDLVPFLVDKSYAQGVGILDFWNGAAESRANLVQGQVQTSEPGVVNKVTHNLMGGMVISQQDCGTKQGISLFTKDEDVQDRYLATAVGKFPRNTLITDDVQQELLKQRVERVTVRSPQTCAAPGTTVCSKCMGLSINHRKPMTIGTNVGTLSAGALSEVSTQLVLSAKHSTTLARKKEDLEGIKGFNLVTEMPKIFPHKQILSEVYGQIYRIVKAPQGGHYLIIRQIRPVPDRYILNAQPDPEMKNHWRYYIPPQRKLLPGIEQGSEVYPGLVLTDGNPNLKDVARLRSLGAARSMATEQVKTVYENTGQHLDRRHYEMLSRAMLDFVRIEKAPQGFPYKRGEVVQYNRLREAVRNIPMTSAKVDMAIGQVLAEEVAGLTIGTDITPAIQKTLKDAGVDSVKITNALEISPEVTGLSRVQNLDEGSWLSRLNHRYLKPTLRDAAAQGMSQTIHGHNPIAAYAYGVELGQDLAEDGAY